MSKLQRNFTTQKQSKRLLELGVPADSADCVAYIVDNSIDLHEDFFLKGDARISVINERHTYTKVTTLEDNEIWLDEPYPCWSVGRLIEILEIILGSPWGDKQLLGKQGTLLERVLSDFEDVVKYKEIFKNNRIDFSKLED